MEGIDIPANIALLVPIVGVFTQLFKVFKIPGGYMPFISMAMGVVVLAVFGGEIESAKQFIAHSFVLGMIASGGHSAISALGKLNPK